MTVIATGKFYEQIAAGESPGQAEGAHGGFGATRNETDFFEEGYGALNALGELYFKFGGYAIAGALLGLIGNGSGDGGIRVAEQHRAPGADKIEELVVVGIVEMLALAALDDERFTPYGTESANGAVDAADQNFFGFSENFAGAAVVAVRCGSGDAHDSGNIFPSFRGDCKTTQTCAGLNARHYGTIQAG
jgi:hypothetical protein